MADDWLRGISLSHSELKDLKAWNLGNINKASECFRALRAGCRNPSSFPRSMIAAKPGKWCKWIKFMNCNPHSRQPRLTEHFYPKFRAATFVVLIPHVMPQAICDKGLTLRLQIFMHSTFFQLWLASRARWSLEIIVVNLPLPGSCLRWARASSFFLLLFLLLLVLENYVLSRYWVSIVSATLNPTCQCTECCLKLFAVAIRRTQVLFVFLIFFLFFSSLYHPPVTETQAGDYVDMIGQTALNITEQVHLSHSAFDICLHAAAIQLNWVHRVSELM